MRNACSFDVLIAGGGLAGQSLALQLKQMRPHITVAVIEPQRRPLPEAAFKVGEATSELGAHYLSNKLGLDGNLHSEHLLKCGLRFFFGNSHATLKERPEYGPRDYPPISSFQLDRGRLETHLRRVNESLGVSLWEGFEVLELKPGQGGSRHVSLVREQGTEIVRSIESAWLVDCTGRKRQLQQQLGLGRPSPLRHSACWFRVAGKCDVEDWIAPEASGWHGRVPGRIRYRSTNHLVGNGYWIWLIPLSSGCTSLGIVVDERIHPITTLDTHARAMEWLQRHEPVLAEHLVGFEVMDFRSVREFSYDTERFISSDRWACVGEAAAFLDPFYSPGADFIAIGNTLVTKLVVRHFDGAPDGDGIEQANAALLQLHRAFTQVFLDQYRTFGHTRVMTAKILWDNASYWVFVCQMFFQDVLLEDESLKRFAGIFERYYQLNLRVQQLFRDWARLSRDCGGYDYLGYADFPIAVRSHLELGTRKTPAKCLDWVEANLDRFSAWAIILFQIAVEDVAPERLDRIQAEELTPDRIDLCDLERTVCLTDRQARAGRNRLLPEYADLRRQMRKLFPEFTCLQPGKPSPSRQGRLSRAAAGLRDERSAG